MLRRGDAPGTPSSKKLRFRGDSSLSQSQKCNKSSRVEDIFDDDTIDKKSSKNNEQDSDDENPSMLEFIKIELTRGYALEHDEERYSARREKIYSFMRIPREVEKFMFYGLMQCIDSFLYIHTFLPIRYCLALWALVSRPICSCFGLRRQRGVQRKLKPAEICDLLKGSIWMFSCFLLLSVDTNRMYHIIKTQSIIKLYIFYNMLEVGDRLLSAFGQDTIDALFWTATEPKNRRSEHFGIITHILFALTYFILHSILIMFQATTLNVAVNSNNKSFLTIMMSNNFLELKGSVFKKFDKNNLFQLTCSDVRERFHLSILLLIVVIQTMKEFSWSLDQFYVMLPDCCYVLITEILIDWIKHAFITRFNELQVDVYREYTISIAYDMMQTRQKHSFSDHSDLVARRMGFIPFPLSVVLIKAIYTSVSFDNFPAFILFVFGYLTLMLCRILNTTFALGKACDLMEQHQKERAQSSSATSSLTSPSGNVNISNIGFCTPKVKTHKSTKIDAAVSPIATNLSYSQKSKKDNLTINEINNSIDLQQNSSVLGLGATALFSNSDVDLDDVCLNEKILNNSDDISNKDYDEDQVVTRSVPDLQQEGNDEQNLDKKNATDVLTRTHKRSESEPSMQSMLSEKETSS